jgi:hypothetical protein
MPAVAFYQFRIAGSFVLRFVKDNMNYGEVEKIIPLV